jgi:Ser/Thr protein kinase RdoA (MazF antagonist)
MNDDGHQRDDGSVAGLEALAHAALTGWGFAATTPVTLIKHRENAVFMVTDPAASARYALRVHRAGYHSEAELRSELAWMRALDADGVLTPPVVAGLDGDILQRVRTDDPGVARHADLFGWVDGTPLGAIEDAAASDVDQLRASLELVGALAGRVHNHSEAWIPPPGFMRPVWDEAGICGDAPIWGPFTALPQLTSPQRAALVASARKLSASMLEFGKENDRYGLIHADFLPENLLVRDDGIRILDFDDCGYGWHLFDVATALFFHLGETTFTDARTSLIAGYRTTRALPDAHLEMLPAFLLARGLTYVSWVTSRRETETARALSAEIIEGVTALASEFLSS